MKRITRLLPIALIALLSFGFTSCDSDYDEWDDRWYDGWDEYSWWNSNYIDPSDDLLAMAQTLRGHWSGTTGARFYDVNNVLHEEVYDTDMEFDQYNSNSLFGRGRQKDFVGNELVLDRTFTWHIDTRTADIYIVYDGSNGQNFQMIIDYDDLHLDDHSFEGVQRGKGETDEFAYQRYTYAKKIEFVDE